MKIIDISCHIVNGGGRNIIFVKTKTDKGITGWGEAFSVGPDQAVSSTINHLKHWITGEDPRDIERLWATMYQGLRFPPGSIGLAAISGIEHTLWDISAKDLGLPVYKLLGGKMRDRVRVYQGCSGKSPKEASELAKHLIKQYGYTSLKMSPFPPDNHLLPWNRVIEDGPKFLGKVRQSVGEDIDIGIDVHAKIFEPRKAVELAKAISKFRPMFFEEAIRPENIREMSWVKKLSPIPIATGEALFTKFQFNDLIRSDAADIIQPDVCICGGLLEMKKIAAIAEGYNITVAPHNPMGPLAGAINVHFAASINNFLILEYKPHDKGRWSEFVKNPWIPVDGHLEIPETPGWGLDIDEDALLKYPPIDWRRGNPINNDNSPALL